MLIKQDLFAHDLSLQPQDNVDCGCNQFVRVMSGYDLNTLRSRQNGSCFANIFKCALVNENVWILISLKWVPKYLINNIPALVQIMAWCHPGNKPISEAMMVWLQTHISATRPQWVKVSGILTYTEIFIISFNSFFCLVSCVAKHPPPQNELILPKFLLAACHQVSITITPHLPLILHLKPVVVTELHIKFPYQVSRIWRIRITFH